MSARIWSWSDQYDIKLQIGSPKPIDRAKLADVAVSMKDVTA